jgi:hypothetical protein
MEVGGERWEIGKKKLGNRDDWLLTTRLWSEEWEKDDRPDDLSQLNKFE